MILIEPKDVIIEGRPYIISKFPAIAGREIIALYPISGMPKVGDYKVNEETMLKLMCYVGVPMGTADPLLLSNRVFVDQHVPSWETLAKIEIAMMEYNCSFFQNGRISTFFQDIAQKLPGWATKMLTALSQQSSPKTKRH